MSRGAVLLLALAACGGNGEVAYADAAPDAPYGCYSDEGGTDMGLALESYDGDAFVEPADGDDILLVLGTQDIFMLVVEPSVELSVDSDSICFQCDVTISPDAYPGEVPQEPIFDRVGPGEFGTTLQVLIGSASDTGPYADHVVDLSVACQGHGYSGLFERHDVKLTLPPDWE